MTVRIAGELPAELVTDAQYAVHRWAKDGRNHRFSREQAGAEVAWPKCTRGQPIPQRTTFRGELSPELGEDRDHPEDCVTCFFTGPRAPRNSLW
ncbi:hypothetical protein [Amycolatopsis jiangsuensis]|uniref:Uncharacterized protein n=1 Tax=Amycolatopsis jiangsuensis TaxID=1181879 RepID=A0A840IU23_9PSEU|nr:hypothetical protein [Amycolatopsis jiangsuensis]MBB4686151.1 hypothetical protein [Amycolatopsis jiangsuensis]